jgi:hypothetical protein
MAIQTPDRLPHSYIDPNRDYQQIHVFWNEFCPNYLSHRSTHRPQLILGQKTIVGTSREFSPKFPR